MTTPPVAVPLEEYLRTIYHPDCDYVDGQVLERNMGELPHGRLQYFLARLLDDQADEWQIEVVTETRLQVTALNYRVPDLMVLALPCHDTRIVHTPPLLCVEILSSEDRMSNIQQRIDDYAQMGVRACWVVDPWRETAFAATADGILHPTTHTLTVPDTTIAIPVPEIWAELERLKRRATGNATA